MLSIYALALSAVMAPGASDVKVPQIVQGALYKNGYTAVIRKVELDADGDTMIGSITPSVMGTFWVYGSPGLKLESMVNTTVTDKVQAVAQSIPVLLALNKGAEVELTTSRNVKLVGKLIDINSVAMVQTDKGLEIVNVNDITQALIKGNVKTTTEVATSTGGLRVKANGPGSLYLLSVEPGLDWTPMYWVDILDDSRLKLTMRTSVTNEIGDLKDADLSFVAGAPNIPFLYENDPFTLFAAQMNARGSAGMPGGFAGGGAMQNRAPAADAGFSMEKAFEAGPADGDAVGELFYYRSKKVELKRGEKGYFVLFENATTYSTLYTLDIPAEEIGDSVPDTWQTIKFKNTSGVPLTTAPATAYKNNNLVGQDMLKYTPAGADGTLRLARAMDIPARFTGTETSNDTVVIDNVTHQRVVRNGKIDIQNMKKEDALIEIETGFNGELLSLDGGGESRKMNQRINQLNPYTSAKWTVRLKPNEKRTLNFSYRRVL